MLDELVAMIQPFYIYMAVVGVIIVAVSVRSMNRQIRESDAGDGTINQDLVALDRILMTCGLLLILLFPAIWGTSALLAWAGSQ